MNTAVGQAQAAIKAVIPKEDRTGNCYVFYAHDQIDGLVKAVNPDWRAGGVLRPESMALKYKHGYVRRCEITALRPQVVSERGSFIQPEERRHLPKIVNLEDESGNVQPLGLIGVKADGKTTSANLGIETMVPDGLLRTVFYPMDEINSLTGRADGLVRMPVSNGEEAARAQYFLFPDWDEITAGLKEVPRKNSELTEYFRRRKAEAATAFETAVADAAIKSCEEYAAWGRQLTTAANTDFQAMKQRGLSAPYGADAEAAFDQLSVQRQDTIQQQQSDQLNSLTDNISRFVEAVMVGGGNGSTVAQQPPTTTEELSEFYAWKAEQAKAQVEAARVQQVADTLREGLVVTVDGKPMTVSTPKGAFGKVGVKGKDGKEELVAKDRIYLIPEEAE